MINAFEFGNAGSSILAPVFKIGKSLDSKVSFFSTCDFKNKTKTAKFFSFENIPIMLGIVSRNEFELDIFPVQ